ncbi:acetyl-CoA carboxylase biotin carboxylase subunit [Rossellomorea vietnamensis]|uniref:biotin carboxylase n=1 Tax=Rossellomorea vietnamensis TaxID=218284 RepID=A0A5D4NPX0_9BACI|nr:acetyl-CoA carboxylase biotin carboxylase subunit [Rossellomorea vietnamensis]TYS16385.1 acetyl-CoA carboxylase biotin carboxylase subunit [Rossellomorea vietnamensis]
MQKILVANRGEIASRIIRTCKNMGIKTIAIYSDADKDMPYVAEADSAFRIGEPPVNKSYLKSDAILEIAEREEADGIHPGYGLLSENSDFARKTRDRGITFIGPSAEVMEMMGDKVAARKTMIAANVPVVPGSEGGVASIEEAKAVAESIGYPVMLKASSGGGGIGMIRCSDEQALVQSFDSTKNRAKAYFGHDEVFLEKCIDNARHIEVQIFGDEKGNIIHLFERNCSVQRRNQKVIEEAPSPQLSSGAKEKMFDAAIRAGKAVNYVNAGTVEFIVDNEENFYFLEMNTRLQVEHPVTESITNLDLVKWQILVSRGEELPISSQEGVRNEGHALEFRVYAEDPKTFFPSPGNISSIKWGTAKNVRIDSGYEQGNNITPFYDPMISKVIISGSTREDCIEEALKFFEDTDIQGVKTNIPLFRDVLKEESFQDGSYNTAWLSSRKPVNN